MDVERALGTGDPKREEEWEDGLLKSNAAVRMNQYINIEPVLKEIERDDAIRNPKKNDRTRHSTGARTEPKVEPEPQVAVADGKPSTGKSASYSGFF